MKATARVITGSVKARAIDIGQGVGVAACGLPTGIDAAANTTERKNLYKPIRVSPEAPQMLVWLTPGNTVDYTIITNLDWQII
jgi:hypothetical protein